jgi:16S rRNA processing protein RimM
MSKEKYLFLGSVRKTYGVAGALIIHTEGYGHRFKKSWEAVFIKIDGILVPFFIESLEQPDPSTLILKIDQLNDRDTAARYIHSEIYINQKDLLGYEQAFDARQLEGFTILDIRSGEVGTVRQYMDIKDNPLFLVSGREKEFYVPASTDLILDVDTVNRIITMQLPEGLTDSQQ